MVLLGLRLRRIVPYALILAAASYFLFLAGRFDYDKSVGSLGPDAWPRLVLTLTIAVCAFEIVRLALFVGSENPHAIGIEGSAQDDAAPADGLTASYMQAGAALVSIALYLLVLPYAGFFLTTFVFLAVFATIVGYRRLLVTLPVTVVLATGFMFLFMRVIYVSLPIGIEPFSKISILMMKLLGVS